MSRVVLGAGVAAALAIGGPPAAEAQPGPDAPAPAPSPAAKDAARKLVAEGIAAFDAKDYDKAIELYRKAYALAAHPLLMFNIGQAHRLAGRPDQAVPYYERYLALEPNGSEAPAARAALAEIKAELAAAGAKAGPAAGAKPGEAGKAGKVTKAGASGTSGEAGATSTTSASGASGEAGATSASGTTTAPTAGGDGTTAAVEPAGAAMPAPVPAEPRRTDTAGSPGRTMRITGLVLGGVGLAGLAFAGYNGKKMLDIEAEAVVEANEHGRTRPELEAKYGDDGNAAELRANIGFVVGGSLVIAGAVTYWLGHRKDRAAEALTTAWTPVVGAGFAGIALSGSLP